MKLEMKRKGDVTVEFFGIPRQRAGRATLTVPAGTVREVLHAVQQACPRLEGLCRSDGTLSPHYLASIEGQRFVSDLAAEVPAGCRLILLSADAGG